MPIYEFYCSDCNTVFNFFSRTVNTSKIPSCPKCKRQELEKYISTFSAISGKKREEGDNDMPNIDEAKMEQAMNLLSHEAEGINEDDPKQAANLMKKFSDLAGIKIGSGMEEALNRMESGEDPEQIEAEMGDILNEEEIFLSGGQVRGAKLDKRTKPLYDKTLYEL